MTNPAEPDLVTINDGKGTSCLVIRSGIALPASRFLTPAESGLQVGYIVHQAGHVIPRHRHRPTERRIVETGEVLVVKAGRCVIEIFSADGAQLGSCELHPGDLVILNGGAHRFEMLEDTILLEIKQGPFLGPGDKEVF